MNDLIGISIGDPEGIGPEITAAALLELPREISSKIVLFGKKSIFEKAFDLIGTKIPREVEVHECVGKALKDAGSITLAALESAVDSALSGKISALVTAPINKGRIIQIDPSFTGHTEYLAKRCSARSATMMFISDHEEKMRISLVTTHLPLSKVAEEIAAEKILKTISMTSSAVSKMDGIATPKIAVCSLNPHAGERGHFGSDEAEKIAPAIALAKAEGIDCSGPHPADAIFSPLSRVKFDAAIAMYHDQGMIPAKILSKGRCVNVTLGLPFFRTSPGHGSADDIAWTGSANKTPMVDAIMAAHRLSLTDKNTED